MLPAWDDVAYALHASLMALAALWLAMWLELDAPYWAGSTVLITSQASRSQGLKKGVNRIVGTAVGIVAGVALIGFDPQGWWGYLVLHTLWLSLCTFVSCLLKDLQSYAAALAGYTALIVAIGSFGQPAQAFDIAVSRGSAVLLGVTLFMVTLHLVTPGNDAPVLRRTLSAWIDGGLALAARLVCGEADERELAQFLQQLAGFDSLIENGATEAPWVGPRRALLRGAVLALADAIMGAAAIAREGRRDASTDALADEIDSLRPRSNPGGPALSPGRRGALGGRTAAPHDARVAALLQHIGIARGGLAALHRDRMPALRNPVARTVDRDVKGAAYAALRAFLGMGSAAAIWVVTRWPSGGDFVEVTGILCCLLASRPSPISNARTFTISTIATGIVALGIGFFVLPLVSGFGWLSAALFPALFAGALGVRSKRFGGYFTPLNFFLMSMIGIQNQMSYDPLTFFNAVEALAAGALFATLMYQLMPPPSTATTAAGLDRRLAAGTDAIAPEQPRGDEARSRHLQRLGALLALVDETEGTRLVDEALKVWPTAVRRESAPDREAHRMRHATPPRGRIDMPKA